MPKHFDLHIRVEEPALGRVMTQLHSTPGVVKVDFDLPDARSAKKTKSNGAAEPDETKPRKTRFVDPSGATGTDIVMKMLSKAKKPVRQYEMGKAFEATGRSPTSYGSAVYTLQKEGVVVNKGDGYVLTKKGRDRARYVR